MLLSTDYTSVRVAVLTGDVIDKLVQRYKGIYYTPDEIKEINKRISEELPGKEDLVTEWFLKNAANGNVGIEYLDDYIESAKLFFAHSKEQLFRDVVEEYQEESPHSLTLNPKNLLSFDLPFLDEIWGLYDTEVEAKTINILPAQLPKGSRIIYDDGTYQVVEAFETDAVCALGRGTKWCTKEEEPAYRYLSKSPLFIFYRGKKKWLQMSMGGEREGAGSVEINDIKNKQVKINDEIRDALIKSGFMDKILEKITRSWFANDEFIRFVGTSPNPFMAEECAKYPKLAYLYANFVLKGPFPAGERAIAQSPDNAIRYVRDVIKRRFLAAEPLIIQLGVADQYVDVLKSVNNRDYLEFSKLMEQ